MAIPRIFSHQFLALHLLRVLRGSLPTYAIQLTPDFEMSDYQRPNLIYEKQDLLIKGVGKYPGYNFYRVAGLAVGGKDKGQAENESPPVDLKSLLP